MAELIASGTTAATSADFTLADGASTSLLLVFGAGPSVPIDCQISVQMKSGSVYIEVGTIDGRDPCKLLSTPGTYRVLKRLSTSAFSVDRN